MCQSLQGFYKNRRFSAETFTKSAAIPHQEPRIASSAAPGSLQKGAPTSAGTITAVYFPLADGGQLTVFGKGLDGCCDGG